MFDLQAMHTHELQLDLGIKEYRLTDLQAMHTHELQHGFKPERSVGASPSSHAYA